MIRRPIVSFTPGKNLEGEDIVVGWRSFQHDFTLSIPPYSVKGLAIDCSMSLLNWDHVPPKENFTAGCKLGDIHRDYFDTSRKKALQLISKLEQSGKVGVIKVTLMVTEKAFPVFGSIKWKVKTVLDGHKLTFVDDFSFTQLRETVNGWRFDSENISNLYLSFFKYIEEQGGTIQNTLKARPSTPDHTSFPDDTHDRIYVRETLCKADPEFASLWNNLSAYRLTYPSILRALEEQKRGRQLDENDEAKMNGLRNTLNTILQKTELLRQTVLSQFKSEPVPPFSGAE